MAVLGNLAIAEALKADRIVISPFKEANLTSCAYDITLGQNIIRQGPEHGIGLDNHTLGPLFIDPWDEVSAKRLWCPKVETSTDAIYIASHEFILAHTEEFIGTRPGSGLTTMMKARSSIGRNGISICRCAGLGDEGFFNRYTMEIINHTDYTIRLKVGARIGQIVFMRVEGSSINYQGKYQGCQDLDTLIETWTPDQMRPKMWMDDH